MNGEASSTQREIAQDQDRRRYCEERNLVKKHKADRDKQIWVLRQWDSGLECGKEEENQQLKEALHLSFPGDALIGEGLVPRLFVRERECVWGNQQCSLQYNQISATFALGSCILLIFCG